ncbi:T9SS type A sorting domain-containing protein [Dyadobacter sp. 676]|uniref:T9SS type A sorting domain-containing protein n=1 Tax=Dyadobacter sp. 676 TaxID=3088362 RepID=A0AAU8FRA6_9BACT
MALSAYPNPFQEEFLIEFDVPEDGSHVKLELVDVAGRVLKTIVDNPHAKGRWKYCSGKLDSGVRTTLCRLKVNDLYTIKKLVKGN